MPDNYPVPRRRDDRSQFSRFRHWVYQRAPRIVITFVWVVSFISSIGGSYAFLDLIPYPGFVRFAVQYFPAVIFSLGLSIITYLVFLVHDKNVQLKSERKCEEEFRIISHRNYLCDHLISKTLIDFHNSHNDFLSREGVNIIHSEIILNIQKILDHSSKIFEDFTGFKCSVCLRMFVVDDKVIISHRVIRDEYSQMNRGTVTGEHPNIEGNTSNIDILILGKPYYASNDLVSERNNGHYVSHRPGWENDYNSTIVYGVPHHDGTEDGIRCLGLFCVDSLYGKLNNDSCLSYAKELSWRLSTMIYVLREFK